MFKSTMIVTFIGLLIKALAFFRDIYIANSFGATWATDAFNISITVTNVIYSVIGVVLTSSLIPLMGKCAKEKGEKELNKLCSNIINITILFSALVIVLVFIFTGAITKIMAPSYVGQAKEFTSLLIRISSISLFPMVVNSVFNAFLYHHNDFLGANISNLMINLTVIVMLILIPDMSIKTLVVVTVISNFVQTMVQIPWILKHKFRYIFILNFNHEIKYIFKMAIPLLLGTFANQLNSIIDKSIASSLPEGSITALSYGYKVIGLPYSIFGYAIVTVAFPMITKMYNNNKDEMLKFIDETTINIAIVMIFSSTYLIGMSTEIVTLLFGYGNFNEKAIAMTSMALVGYCIGMAFLAIKDLYIRVFYTIQNSKYVMKITIISVFINIILNITLVKYLGVLALSASTSISLITVTALGYFKIKKSFGGDYKNGVIKELFKIEVASILAIVPISMIYRVITNNENGIESIMILVVFSLMSLLIYIMLLYIFRIKVVIKYVGILVKKLKTYVK